MYKSAFIIRTVLVVMSVLILLGVVLMLWMLATEDDRNNIHVHLSNGITEDIHFEALSLVPGEQCEYTLTLKSDNASKYKLTLKFIERSEGTLKNYARVKLITSAGDIYDELLVTAFDGEGIILPVDFDAKQNTMITIVYYLPIEIGNEAKNAEALFDLHLTASDE